MWQNLLTGITGGDVKALARSISLVENETAGYEELLESLPHNPKAKIIGITGPPGAGKSTLTDAFIYKLIEAGHKVGVLCVDPSSPFNLGAVLGDRIRMSNWYNHPNVFIRSLATRGAMGGLHPKIIEISELLKTGGYDRIIVETVGVGQSEIEIAGLADVTVVVLVPEAGDEVQTMKAGLMEIADIFVVNKSDRPDADQFVNNLRSMLAPSFTQHKEEVPIVKTIASENTGVNILIDAVNKIIAQEKDNERKDWLLTEKAYYIIQQDRMKNINKSELKKQITESGEKSFNLYAFARQFKS